MKTIKQITQDKKEERELLEEIAMQEEELKDTNWEYIELLEKYGAI